MSQRHVLKTLPGYFWVQATGSKPFEVRRNDREFRVGDTLILQEFIPPGTCTGLELEREVTYVLDDPAYCKKGFVILGTADRKASGERIEAMARLQAFEKAMETVELVRAPRHKHSDISPAVAKEVEAVER